jgi:hypothetical protein
MRVVAFIASAIAGFGASVMVKNKTQNQRSAKKLFTQTRLAPTSQKADYPSSINLREATHYAKADILISAGPRKGQKDTELGEDVAGTVLTSDKIVFWVLDGTSDSDIIVTEQGSELFSSRLLALTLGAALRQLAPRYPTAESLWTVALETVTIHLQEQIALQRTRLEKFVATQQPGLDYWQVSTTALLGMLSSDKSADLLRIGDSKALCFSEEFEPIDCPISNKPESKGLGRLYARLNHCPENTDSPFTLTLISPPRLEQMHLAQVDEVRHIIAFTDGIGPPTEQYLKVMLGRQAHHQFQAGFTRTPNRTFDDKTLVMVSFEPLQTL